MTEQELLEVISKLEESLGRIIDRADNVQGTGGNNNNRVNTRMHSGRNPYDENTESKKYERAEKYLKERNEFDTELSKKRIENEISLWNGGYRRAIKEKEKYQLDLQDARLRKELDFWKQNKKEIKELDALENSLIERREAKQLRSRKRAAELEDKTTDARGRTKSNKEIREKIDKFKEFNQENTPTRAVAMAVSAVTAKMTQGVDFLASDKKVTLTEVGDKLSSIASQFGAVGGAIGGVIKLVFSALEAYDKVNAASSKYARSVGGGAAKMEKMKVLSVDVANNISKWGGNTYKFSEILEHTAELSEKTGRAMDHITNADFKSMEDLRRYGIDNDVLNMYDSFGLSMEDIDKRVTSVYQKAGKHGLNAKAVTDAVNKNLKMAQQYTFAGGQRALERMAEKSVALKYNMESVAKFADKVSTLEGAAQAGAQLSVLGGNFARMGNPLSMLYGGLQDPERLNEYMINMVQGMAHWDSQKGQIDLAAADRMRLKAAADATGVDYTDFLNMAMNQERQNLVARDIRGGLDSETEQYIKNIATIKKDEKTGQAQAWVKINGEDKKVSDLTSKDKAALQKESEDMEAKNAAGIGDIYAQTRTLTDKLNDYIDWIRNKFFAVILKIAGYDAETLGAMNKYDLDAEDAQKVVDKERQARLTGAGIGAAGGLAAGAAIGSALGPAGTAIGAVVGGLIGLFGGGSAGYAVGDATWSSDAYAKELAQQDKYKKKALGSIGPEGIVSSQYGTSMSDNVPTLLSPGEMVMNAKATQEHLPQLKAWNQDKVKHYSGGTTEDDIKNTLIKASEEQTKPMQVNPVESSMMGAGNMAIEPLTINPITINVSGTINLTGGGGTASLNIKDLINDNTFVSLLTRELERTMNHSFNAGETKSHMPFYIPPMSMA